MAQERRFRRASEDERRAELIEATLQVIAEEGLQGATVRNIAARTEVTAGLIRHYFAGKDELVHSAYKVLVTRMLALSRAAIAAETGAARRMRTFIATQFRSPLLSPGFFRQWAIFVSLIHLDPAIAAIHHDGFALFRTEVEGLIGDVLTEQGRPLPSSGLPRLALAVNAVLDGLWLESCLQHSGAPPPEHEQIAVQAIEALVGIRLPVLEATS